MARSSVALVWKQLKQVNISLKLQSGWLALNTLGVVKHSQIVYELVFWDFAFSFSGGPE